MAEESPEYTTTNTELASYLIIKGIELLEIIPSQTSHTFVFANHNDATKLLVLEFNTEQGDAQITRRFYRTYRDLLRQIKETRRGYPFDSRS